MATPRSISLPGLPGRAAAANVSTALLTGVMLVVVALGVTITIPATAPITAVMIVGVGALAVWMFLSPRTEITLAVLLLYLGLLDGYLKLKTGNSVATLGRDIMLYAIVAGLIVRNLVKKQALDIPPLTGWIVAWTVVICVQLFNPVNGTWGHSLASLRPHLEFVPLFFLGYMVMRSKARLQMFLVLLLIVGAANGLVGFIQFNLTPEQLASWGPGYERRINGTGDVAGRAFRDEDGTLRTRPFGLGSDMGLGGAWGVIAIPGAFALLALARRQRLKLLTLALTAGAVVAVVTSQSRAAVVGGVLAVAAFALLAAASGRALRTVWSVVAGGVVIWLTVSVLTAASDSSAFSRYENIRPGQAAETTVDYRRETINRVPGYVLSFPLGAGIGSKGPAGGVEGRSTVGGALDGESQPTYMLIEAGVPGLVVFYGFILHLFLLAFRRIRRLADVETRMLLAGLAAPIIAIFVSGIVGISSATSPTSPYLWFVGGVLVYWLAPPSRREMAERRRRRRSSGPGQVSIEGTAAPQATLA